MAAEPVHKPKLLVVGDAVAPTGFARVVRGILCGLDEAAYEIHHLGINYHGDPHGERWPVYPARLGGDPHGVGRLKEMLEKVRPDLVLTVNDLWIQRQYFEILRAHRGNARVVAYAPVDAGPVDPEWLAGRECLSRLVLYTEHAREEVQKALGPGSLLPLEVIPHGVDPAVFFPMGGTGSAEEVSRTREAKAKLRLFPDSEIDDSFVVLNAHRNQPRKRIDITLKAFALFARDKPPGVQLCLHMGTEDLGWNVLKLARRYGVFDRLILTDSPSGIPQVTSEQLNVIYNACDVGLNTSSGEGWGLPNFEHAAAGKPQIVPRFGALAEIWEGAAEFVEPTSEVVYEGILTEGRLVAPEDVARALELLYKDRDRRAAVAWACYRRAVRSENRWESISRRWHALFQEVLSLEETPLAARPNRKAECLIKALEEAPPGLVVEIGSAREAREVPTDGCSTHYLARWCSEVERPFRSFDSDERSVAAARSLLGASGLSDAVECRDGRAALSDTGPVSFLYLDGSDDPVEALEQLLAAELVPGAVLVVDDAQSYGEGAHGKATALIQRFDAAPVPRVPFRIVPTEPGYSALIATFPAGKRRGSLEARETIA